MKTEDLKLRGYVVVFLALLMLITFLSSFSSALVVERLTSDKIVSGLAMNIFINEDDVLIASGKEGVSYYNKQTQEVRGFKQDGKKIVGDVHSGIVAFDKIWLATEKGINVIDKDDKITLIEEIETTLIGKAIEKRKAKVIKARGMWFKDGALWVCCFGLAGGLYRYDGKAWEELRFGGNSSLNYVSDMEVLNDEIWFGTYGFGVYIYNKKEKDIYKAWQYLNSGSEKKIGAALPNDTVSSLAIAEDSIWIGTNIAVCQVKKGANNTLEITAYNDKNTNGAIKFPVITAVEVVENGDVYTGTMKGLMKYSNGSWEEVIPKTPDDKPIILRKVFSLRADGNALWVGSNAGIMKIE